MKTKTFKVTNCKNCPNCEVKRTPVAGYADDYWCKAVGQIIAGYVEWADEGPQDGVFPKFCPLKNSIVKDKKG